MTSLNSARPVMQWNERGVSVAIWKRAHEGGIAPATSEETT